MQVVSNLRIHLVILSFSLRQECHLFSRTTAGIARVVAMDCLRGSFVAGRARIHRNDEAWLYAAALDPCSVSGLKSTWVGIETAPPRDARARHPTEREAQLCSDFTLPHPLGDV